MFGKGVIRRTTEVTIVSWKEAAIQGGLELEGRGIVLVRSRYQGMSSNRLITLDFVL
jgi:hypothetical protein